MQRIYIWINRTAHRQRGSGRKKQIFDKGSKRVAAVSQEEYTLSIKGSNDLPDIAQLKSIRKYVFVIDADTQALRQAVEHSLNMLRWKYPEYEFWAIYGGGN